MATSLGDLATGSGRVHSAGIEAVLDVLEALDSRQPLTLAQLARQTTVAKSTLHRACLAMEERGWITRATQGAAIESGPRIAHLAQLARTTPASALTARFHAVGARLVAEHNETTGLTVLDGRDSVFIAKEETTHPVRLVTAVGSRLPAFASASGRVMLADLPEGAVSGMYSGCDELVTPTGRRLSLSELFAILVRVRLRGYGENLDETALGLHCIAVPVGQPGRVIAAVTVCVPTGRMSPERKPQLVEAARAAAAELVPTRRALAPASDLNRIQTKVAR